MPNNKDVVKFGFVEKLKMAKDEKGNPIYDEALLKRINSVQFSASNSFTKA